VSRLVVYVVLDIVIGTFDCKLVICLVVVFSVVPLTGKNCVWIKFWLTVFAVFILIGGVEYKETPLVVEILVDLTVLVVVLADVVFVTVVFAEVVVVAVVVVVVRIKGVVFFAVMIVFVVVIVVFIVGIMLGFWVLCFSVEIRLACVCDAVVGSSVCFSAEIGGPLLGLIDVEALESMSKVSFWVSGEVNIAGFVVVSSKRVRVDFPGSMVVALFCFFVEIWFENWFVSFGGGVPEYPLGGWVVLASFGKVPGTVLDPFVVSGCGSFDVRFVGKVPGTVLDG
jgi:hypothetical protein